MPDYWWTGLLATALGAVLGYGSAFLTQRQQWRQERVRRRQEWEQQRRLRFEDQRRSLYATFAADFTKAFNHLNTLALGGDKSSPSIVMRILRSPLPWLRSFFSDTDWEAEDLRSYSRQAEAEGLATFDEMVDNLRHSYLEMALISIDERVPDAAIEAVDALLGVHEYLFGPRDISYTEESLRNWDITTFDPNEYIARVAGEHKQRTDVAADSLERFLEAARNELGEGTL